jgi:polyisoprenoid-binding protein YceI
MNARILAPLALCALLLPAGLAHADAVVANRSEIGFTIKQMGVNFDGRFTRWKADVVFEPNALARSKADVDVELASIDLASVESEVEAKSSRWFDTAKFPVARFTSTSIRSVGGDRFDVAGKLSLKGVTRDYTVPIAVKTDGAGNRVLEGSFALNRRDYRIGEGEWADPSITGDNVVVRVRMVLRPAA